MAYNFDEETERRFSGCVKWTEYDPDVIPVWVADMDFRSPEPVIAALRKRAEHGVFGYEWPRTDLSELVCERMARLYNWKVHPSEVVFLPGIVCGLNVVCRAVGKPGDAAITFTPVYPPFLFAPNNQEMILQTAALKPIADGRILRYEIDFDAFKKAITPATRILLLCHPHNPIGREFTYDELNSLSQICIDNDIIICSDEIHCDLLIGEVSHTPTACLSPEIADRSITLMAPSKTFNISGLGASYAIIQNADLRKRVKKAAAGIVPELNIFSIAAFKAAYTSCDEWLEAVLAYLVGNRNTFVDYVLKNLPGIKTTLPEATYLAWLDCRESGIAGNPHQFFLEESRVATNDGESFGPGGAGFVRFNFGCPRSIMLRALDRMKSALSHRL